MSARRSSQRRGRGVGHRVPGSPPTPKTPATTEAADTVRQQLQAKVADSLNSRGVNTTDRWQAKPTGALTPEEQRRLDRQRANKRRWAQKERERSKKEMEALRKENADLEKKHRELQGQVDQLKKLKYNLKTALSEHKCKSLAPKVKLTPPPEFPPRKTGKTKVISNGETRYAPASGRRVVLPKSASGKGKRLVRTNISGWKRSDPTYKQNEEMTSGTGDGSPRRSHDPMSIDAILDSASKVPATVTLHTTTNSEQCEVSCTNDMQASAEDDQDPSHNQVQQDYLRIDDGFTRQSEEFSMTEGPDFHGSYLRMLQEDEFSSDIQPNSVTPLGTWSSGTDMDYFMALEIFGENNSASSSDSLMFNSTSVSEDGDTICCNSRPLPVLKGHKKNGGKCTVVSHTDTGPGTKAEDIFTTELTLNTRVTEMRHVKPISGDCEDHNTTLKHLPSNSCYETSSTAEDRFSELIMCSESNTCRNGVISPAATTSKGGSPDARDHTMMSVVPKPSIVLPDRTTPASATTKHYLEKGSKYTLFKKPSTNANNSQKRYIMDIPVKLNREANKISDICDTSNTRTEQFKRSKSWDDNCEKTEGSTKRSRFLSLSSSLPRNSLHAISNTTQDTTDMNKNDENPNHRSATNVQMTTTASRIEEDGVQPLTMTLTSSSAVSSGDVLLRKTGSIMLMAPNTVPASPSTSSSPELTSPFQAREGADRNVEEGPGDSSIVMIEVTADEVTDGLEDMLRDMPVFPEEVVESVLQILELAT